VQSCDARVASGIDERRTPDSNTNKPTTILALRLRAAFWPSVNSASFGIPRDGLF
jgi:hypothetical protein